MKYTRTIINALLWMNWIQLSSGFAIDPCSMDATGMCDIIVNDIPGVVSKVADIPNILDDVEDILDEIPNIVTMVQQIPDMVKILELLIKNPLKVTDNLDDEINELADELETCIGQVIDLIDPMKPIYDLLLKNIPEIDIDFIPDLPDINDLVYKAAAVVLLPFKSAVELTCDKVLPEAISAVTSGLNGMSLPRRRRMKSKKEKAEICLAKDEDEDEICPEKTFTWTHDDGNNDYTDMARETPRLIDEENLSGGSEAYVYQEIRIAKIIFDAIITVLEGVCEIPERLLAEPAKNADAVQKAEALKNAEHVHGNNLFFACKGFKAILEFINVILDYHIGCADLHDGLVQFTMITAIFNDRITIIDNQRKILKAIHQSSVDTTDNVENGVKVIQAAIDKSSLDTTTTVENSTFTVLKRLNLIQAAIDILPSNIHNLEMIADAKGEFSMNVDKALENDETGLITIILKMRDFVFFVAISIGCCLFFLVIGIVIGNCCLYRYKSPGGYIFAAVPKYDYTTSDIEDSSK